MVLSCRSSLFFFEALVLCFSLSHPTHPLIHAVFFSFGYFLLILYRSTFVQLTLLTPSSLNGDLNILAISMNSKYLSFYHHDCLLSHTYYFSSYYYFSSDYFSLIIFALFIPMHACNTSIILLLPFWDGRIMNQHLTGVYFWDGGIMAQLLQKCPVWSSKHHHCGLFTLFLIRSLLVPSLLATNVFNVSMNLCVVILCHGLHIYSHFI